MFDTIKIGVKRYYSVAKTQLIHYSPEIRMIGGTALVIYGAYKIYKAGKQNEIDGIDKHFEQQMDDLEKAHAPKSIHNQAKWFAIREYVLYKVRICSVGALCVAGGTMLEWSAFNAVKARNALLGASLAAAVAANKKLTENIAAKLDPETAGTEFMVDDITVDADDYKTIAHKETDENGNETTVIDGEAMVINVDRVHDIPGTGFIVCKETLPLGHDLLRDEGLFENLVSAVVTDIRSKIKNTDGYAFEADIFKKSFGVEPNVLHHTSGWVNGDAMDLTFRRIIIRYEDDSEDMGWYVKPVGDHSIIDIYQKYSLNMARRGNNK